MNKNIQVVLIILAISLGASIRLGILGWLFILGVVSIVVLSIVHLTIHFYSMNYITGKNRSVFISVLLSHLSFLGMFLFQMDFDDSRSYSAIGKFLGLDNDIFLPYSMSFLLISLSIYVLVSFFILRKAKRETARQGNRKYLFVTIVSAFILTVLITIVPPSVKYANEAMKYNEEHYPDSYSRKLDSAVRIFFPNSISLSHRIIESDSSIRWVNQTFVNEKITDENRRNIFARLDTLSLKISKTGTFNNDVVFNYYFSDEFIHLKKNTNRIAFFDYSGFDSKYNLHYRVSCDLLDSLMSISQRKLFRN